MDQRTTRPSDLYPALRKLYSAEEVERFEFAVSQLDLEYLGKLNEMASAYPDMVRKMLDQVEERIAKSGGE